MISYEYHLLVGTYIWTVISYKCYHLHGHTHLPSLDIALSCGQHTAYCSNMGVLRAYVLLVFVYTCMGQYTYPVDDTPGLGRVFDGIGAISGGGVSILDL